MNSLFLFAIASAQPQVPAENPKGEQIVVTASLAPVSMDEAPASVTLFDAAQIEALGRTFAADLVRLAPGVTVSPSGGEGTLTQVRIRGAEANHSLLFIDGIAFNDLAAANEPRLERVMATGLGRIEVIRGPQSALWGSEALGGVIAMGTAEPLGQPRAGASLEYGSRDSSQISAAAASGGDKAGVSGTASWARSDGIDILGGGAGDLDGFENITASLKGLVRTGSGIELGAVARYVHHDFEYDGQNAFFQRADTAEAALAETYAARGWVGIGADEASPSSARLEAQYLDSQNRNRDGSMRTNDSFGRRWRIRAQAEHRLDAGRGRHELIAVAEREQEKFGTRDLRTGGSPDRDLERSRTAWVGEWRARWNSRFVTDIAVRHDDFGRFEDQTSFRANIVFNVTPAVALLAGYGEGIAQPTFADLFGFDANDGFVGNPNLRPERSRGFEAGLRWRGSKASIEAVAFSNDLQDEIVEDFATLPFPNYTIVNASGKSRRRGLELSGEWRPVQGLRLGANYSYIDTRENDAGAGEALGEIRRPKHSGNLFADLERGPFTFAGSLSYVGSRRDRDFDVFPYPRVKLDPYVLAGARVAYRLSEILEAFARVENAFGANYQDLVGYVTPGRAVYAGLRLRLGN